MSGRKVKYLEFFEIQNFQKIYIFFKGRFICLQTKLRTVRTIFAGETYTHSERIWEFPSARELADRLQIRGLDVDKNAIQRIEAGKRFVTDIELSYIATIFNKSIDELIKYS